MLDICYYNEQIKDELDGARDYIKRAIDCKEACPEWASLYSSMSQAELDHASNLIKIFEDDYKKTIERFDGEIPSIYKETHKTINDMYVECAAKIKYMYEIYKEK